MSIKITGWKLFFVSVVLFLPFFGWACTRIVKEAQFDNNCLYHITNYQSAETLDESIIELNLAIQYAESHKLTNGFTSITDRNKSEDIGVWYQDLKEKQLFLENIKKTDPKKFDDFLAIVKKKNYIAGIAQSPSGISIYLHNTLYLIWFLVSIILVGFGIFGIAVFFNEKSKN